MDQNQLILMVLTLLGLTFVILPDQSFETDQANTGLGSLTLSFEKLILPDQLFSPSFDPEEISDCQCSQKILDIFIVFNS